MAEHVPIAAHAPRAVRLIAIAIALLGAALAIRTTITSSQWVGRVFPGFVMVFERIVASVSLPNWSATTVPGLYMSQVVAANGQPVRTTTEVYGAVAELPPGTPVHYRLWKDDQQNEVTVDTQRFSFRDWLLIFGMYLLNGTVSLAVGLSVWVLRPRAPAARALLPAGIVMALWTFTAMDVYGPGSFSRLHVVGEAFTPAALLHLAMVFPEQHPRAYLSSLGYLVATVLLVLYQMFMFHGTEFVPVHNLCVLYFGVAGLFLGWRLVHAYWRRGSPLARQRVRVIALGAALGVGAPGAIMVTSAATGGQLPVNFVAFAGFLFPLSLGYAIVKHDLFEIDAMIRRGAYYLLLTGAVGAAYVVAVGVLNLLLRVGVVSDSPAFAVLFTLIVLLLFNPLRTRLQAFVDRVFFGDRYDGAQVLAAVGGKLASALTRDDINRLVQESVEAAIPNGSTQLLERVPPALARWLMRGRVLSAADSPEQYPDAASHETVRAALTELGAEIAVPIQRSGELVGVLTCGPKRSGVFYSAGDAEFLRALGQEAAIALQNAASYEALAALNAGLEERVRERTARLVQAEKMASLGRLVAGVAHEINNPVSFVSSTVRPLRARLKEAAAAAPPAAQGSLREAGELVDIMARGAERTAAIVKDLRSFSRLGEGRRKAVDLHEGLEVSLRLLEAHWRDRIVIHRDYGTLPPVECDPGQVNQVFMNLLTNACEAIAATGNIWVRTRVEGAMVRVTIRDDGCGMAPEAAERIFDPFFTTKDVGQGTGMGLAISHGIVTAHGGRIEVVSAPGTGTTFDVVLPIDADVAGQSRAASVG